MAKISLTPPGFGPGPYTAMWEVGVRNDGEIISFGDHLEICQ